MSVNDCFWEYYKKSYWTPLQGFCILMNVYRLFKIFTLGSISQNGTLLQIMSNAYSLYMIQLAGKEPNSFQEVSKLIELKSISKIFFKEKICLYFYNNFVSVCVLAILFPSLHESKISQIFLGVAPTPRPTKKI